MAFTSSLNSGKQVNQEFIIKTVASANGGIPVFGNNTVDELIYRTTATTDNNASLLTTIAWVQAYVSSLGESDTLQTVTERTNGNTTNIAVQFTNSTASSSTTTGALRVTGGVGIGGNAFIGGNVDASKFLGYLSDTALAPSFTWTGDTDTGVFSAGADQIGFTTGGTARLTVSTTVLTISLATQINNTLGVTGITSLTANSAATSTATGTLRVTGGTGVTGDLWVGLTGNFAGILTTTNTTASSSITTGSLQARGGAGISGDLWVGLTGNFAGAVSITNSTASTSTTTGALRVTGGVGIQGALWAALTTITGLTVNGNSQLNGTLGVTGITSLTANSAATSTATGTLRVTGGTGVTGDLWVGLTGNFAGAVSITNSTASTSTTTGALRVTGGAGIGGALYAGSLFDNGNRVMYVNPRSTADVNTFRDSGVYGLDSANANSPGGGFTSMFVARNGSDVGLQIAGGHSNDFLKFRGWSSSGTTFTAWRTVWHDGNFTPSSYMQNAFTAIANNTGVAQFAAVGASTFRVNGSNGVDITFTANNTINAALATQALNLHNLATNGIMVKTGGAAGSGTFTARSIAQGTGILVTNGDGIAANPTVALDTTYLNNNYQAKSNYLDTQTAGSLDVNSTSLGTKLFLGSSGSWTNRGTTGNNGSALFSMNTHSGIYYNQFWFDTNGDDFYHRSIDNGAFRTWQKVLTAKHFGTGAGQVAEGNHTHSGYATTTELDNYVTLSTTQANISGAKTFTNITTISNATASTATSNGALVVAGGVGVAGSVNANRVLTNDGTAAAPSFSWISDVDTGLYRIGADQIGISTGGTVRITVSTTTTTISIATQINSTLGVTGATTLSSTLGVTGITSITNATASTATTNGALIVTGGVGIGGSVNANRVLTNDGTAAAPSFSWISDVDTGLYRVGTDQIGISTGGTVRITQSNTATTISTVTSIINTTASTATTNGALVVSGGVGIAGNLNVGGTLNLFSNVATFWNASLGNTERGYWSLLYSALGSGRILHTDEEFGVGFNGVTVYNNSGGSPISLSRIADASAPNTTGQVIRISHNGATASPGLGGFVQNITARRNAVIVQRFRAKIPVGFSVMNAENSMGTGANVFWITPRVGTGRWEEYIRVVSCGHTGTFSSGGHVYIEGTPASVFEWFLASCTAIEVNSAPSSFANVTVGGTTAIATGLDTLTIVGSGATSASLNASTKTLTISSTDTNTLYPEITEANSDSSVSSTESSITGRRLNSWATRKGFITNADNYVTLNTEQQIMATKSFETIILNSTNDSTINPSLVIYSGMPNPDGTPSGGHASIGGNVSIGGTTTISRNAAATSTSTGSLQVVGGVGITGALWVGSYINVGGITGTSLTVNGATQISSTLGVTGITSLTANSASTSTTTGTLRVTGGTGITGDLWVGLTGNFAGVVSITNSTASTSTTTGALRVTGGVGIQGALWAALTTITGLTVNGNSQLNGTLGVTGITSLTANSASTSTTTGTLRVTGGVGVTGALYAGSLFDNGTRVSVITHSHNSYDLTDVTSATRATAGHYLKGNGTQWFNSHFETDVRATPLTGMTIPSTAPSTISTADTVTTAFGGLQSQINAVKNGSSSAYLSTYEGGTVNPTGYTPHAALAQDNALVRFFNGKWNTADSSKQNLHTTFAMVNANDDGTYKPVLQALRSRGTLASPTAVSSGDTIFSFLGNGYSGTSMVTAAGIEFFVDGTVSTFDVPMRISFTTATSGSDRKERLTIKSNGNIGIGTNFPAHTLHVHGNSNMLMQLYYGQDYDTFSAALNVRGPKNHQQSFYIGSWDAAASDSAFWSIYNGKNSQQLAFWNNKTNKDILRLDVDQGAEVLTRFSVVNDGGARQFTVDNTGWAAFNGGVSIGSTLTLCGSGTNQFVNGTGDGVTKATHNFGLKGHNGMAFKTYDNTITGVFDFRTGSLDLDGTIKANYGNANNFQTNAGNLNGYRFWENADNYKIFMSISNITGTRNLTGTGDYNMYFRMTGTGRGFVFQNGNTDNTNNMFQIDGTGNVVARGNITAYSDIRVKTNVQSYENGLDKLLSLRPVTYDRTDMVKHESGFIAQEVQKVDDSLVVGNEDGMLSLDYSRMVVMLTKAVQEQQEIINKLNKRIDDLESK
jgi:hypothetical protein